MNAPKVTVLMPVYNGEKYLREAIESILNQTYRDFEFLIINDGSTDGSPQLIESYDDPRIRVVNNESNIKLIATLNKGLKIARGEYVARMDCDDISLSRRLEKQVMYLDQHPEVGVLGCRIRNIDASGDFISEPKRPLTHICNMWVLLFEPSVMHPSVIYRKDIVERVNGYSEEALHSEDYDLWSKLSRVTEIRQLDDVLVYLRKHNRNIGALFKEIQLTNSMEISKKNISDLIGGTADIQTLEDTVRFVTQTGAHSLRNKKVFELLFLIYGNFLSVHNLSYEDRDWITSRFVSIIAPLIRQPFLSQIDIIYNGLKSLYFYEKMLFLKFLMFTYSRMVRQKAIRTSASAFG